MRDLVPLDIGDDEAGILLDVLRHFGNGGGFKAQVQFDAHRMVEGFDDLGWFQAPA